VGLRPDITEEDLNNLADWDSKSCMTFNVEKCFVMHMGLNNVNWDYSLNHNVLESVQREPDLGFEMSYQCDWKDQIEKAVGKKNQTASWVFRNIVSRSKCVLVPIYKALVRANWNIVCSYDHKL
jgi:hypothetical protein